VAGDTSSPVTYLQIRKYQMGLFSRNYDRPGPGIKKDEPRKKGIPRFFELLFRDLGDIIKLNILFFLTLLPTGITFAMGLLGIYSQVTFILSLVLAFPVGGAVVSVIYYITKMMRDDPSYVWYEFKRKFLENYKQAAPAGIFCTAFIYAQVLIWSSLWGALIAEEPIGDLLWYLLALFALLLFSMITPYIFLHFAYITLKTSKIIKNSILMSFGYFPRSFMGALLGGIMWIVFVLYLPMSLMFSPLIMLFGITLSMLLTLSWVWPPFNKHFNIEETLVKRQEESS